MKTETVILIGVIGVVAYVLITAKTTPVQAVITTAQVGQASPAVANAVANAQAVNQGLVAATAGANLISGLLNGSGNDN